MRINNKFDSALNFTNFILYDWIKYILNREYRIYFHSSSRNSKSFDFSSKCSFSSTSEEFGFSNCYSYFSDFSSFFIFLDSDLFYLCDLYDLSDFCGFSIFSNLFIYVFLFLYFLFDYDFSSSRRLFWYYERLSILLEAIEVLEMLKNLSSHFSLKISYILISASFACNIVFNWE